jgi:hypothetical protein
MSRHWLTRYDPDDGEPYGTLCDCEIGDDHDGAGNPVGIQNADAADADALWGIPRMRKAPKSSTSRGDRNMRRPAVTLQLEPGQPPWRPCSTAAGRPYLTVSTGAGPPGDAVLKIGARMWLMSRTTYAGPWSGYAYIPLRPRDLPRLRRRCNRPDRYVRLRERWLLRPGVTRASAEGTGWDTVLRDVPPATGSGMVPTFGREPWLPCLGTVKMRDFACDPVFPSAPVEGVFVYGTEERDRWYFCRVAVTRSPDPSRVQSTARYAYVPLSRWEFLQVQHRHPSERRRPRVMFRVAGREFRLPGGRLTRARLLARPGVRYAPAAGDGGLQRITSSEKPGIAGTVWGLPEQSFPPGLGEVA